MSVKKKIALVALSVIAAIVLALLGVYLRSCVFPPHYNNMEERAEEALAFCKSKGLNTDYCLFVDFGKESKERRFFIYDFNRCKVIHQGLCAHGKGFPSTKDRAAFSNIIGSKCSSLGKFKVTDYRIGERVKRCYELDGYDLFLNSSARMRQLLIHTSRTVNKYEANNLGNIPLSNISEGCFAISSNSFNKLEMIKGKAENPMLLWAYDGDRY